MSDGGAASEIGAGADAGEAGGGAGGGGGGGGAGPEWLAGLPDDLKGDATLGRYANIEALARGHVETRKLLSNRLAVPQADAPAEEWGKVFDALGRPAEAKDYEIPLPEGMQASGIADAFRPVAHQLGLLPAQAKGVVEFYNKLNTDLDAAGQAQIDALKGEIPDYDGKIALAKSAVAKLGLSDEFLTAAENRFGTAELIKGFIKLGELVGEHGRVDGEGGAITANLANAEAQLTELQKDKNWRDKLKAKDAVTVAQYERLKQAAMQQATGR